MYPDQIKNYHSEEQFLKHRQLLHDLQEYYEKHLESQNSTFRNLKDEKNLLERSYRKWKEINKNS